MPFSSCDTPRWWPPAVGVIVQCQRELHRLFSTLSGVEGVFAQEQNLPPFELHCPLMNLPLAFGTTLQSVPASVPYLHADPQLSEIWRQRLAQDAHRLKVGLVWAGSPTKRNDHTRSMPLSALAALAQVEGVSFYSLQKGEAAGQRRPPARPEADRLDRRAE